jgi:2-polyprenyl-6-methoxyphenol hydroxylase-like FAD-dependent oxidoreductase
VPFDPTGALDVSPPPRAEVLVVGAGPTGLVLSLWLRRAGVAVRIIDQTAGPGTTSRALAVHARTLELYRPLGLADDVIARGLEFAAVNLWVRGTHAARVAFGEIGRGLSPYPFIVMFPQDQHEELLLERLRREGVEVERRTELAGFDERGDGIVARLRGPDVAETTCEAAFIAGCDGARSRVREVLGVGFPGGTYERVFYVADVELHGRVDDHELHVALDEADLIAVFPMKGEHAARLIGTVRREAEERQDLSWADVSRRAAGRLDMTVDRVNWFSTYRVHHRVAERFRSGRAFLAGDAAHIHSPVGGQGMNTGIGDAVNLAWKLAAVLRGRAPAGLLDSYEPERIAFARRLVATTDRAFTFVTRDGALARRVRLDVVPRVAPVLLNRAATRRLMFRTISQTSVSYRHGELGEGKAGSLRGGDRLPWVEPHRAGGADNFTPLSSLDWQLHVYGEPSRELAAACAERGLALHAFPWEARMGRSGLARDAAYLVRPDGYVALADPDARPATLHRYADARALRFR